MIRLIGEIRVLAAVLVLSLALALCYGSAANATSPGTSVELHDMADVHHASNPHEAYVQESCGDQLTDCCLSVAHCSSASCSAFVAPVGAPGFAYCQPRAWTTADARCLKGLDPLVNRHPPRDLY
jgi:hypothetical protein